ncbi:hypothetical protein BCR44DRAFT_1500147 [Catenaria anguillulae PL171]|uniref:Histone deacetylase complex subunit SAP30 Sin3 binding domain-containing protein n=1 Tax=Catenaria anguillulae PL171 TaxID=765915 RepID=A0A1Y2HMQ4_9FUNG|nr:hypothetical protein BCR44DRAFT_1500147 [Catenaria anguillulae PL171]
MDHLSAAAQSAMMQSSEPAITPATSLAPSYSGPEPPPAPSHPPPAQMHAHLPAPVPVPAPAPAPALPALPTAEETIKAIVQSQGYSFLDRYVSIHHLLTPFQQQHATLDHLFDLVVKHYEAQAVDEADVLLRFKSKLADDRKASARLVGAQGQGQGDDAAVKAERKGPQMRMMDYGHAYYQQYRGTAEVAGQPGMNPQR